MGKHQKSNKKNEKSDSNLDSHIEKNSNNSIVWLIFSLGIFVVLFSLISVVFPGLIISVVDVNPFGEQFEIGAMGIPFLIVNFIVFSLIVLGLKHRLPNTFTNIIQKILSFDLSRKNSFMFFLIILAIYIATSANELSTYELSQYGDFMIVESALEIWPEQESENK